MDIGGLALFGQMKSKMHWHDARQKVLAQNVANADTPNFRGSDLRAFDVNSTFDRQMPMRAVSTNTAHMEIFGSPDEPRSRKGKGYETTPYKNSVTAEQEMLKVTQNQMDYQVASTVYQKNLGFLRIAARR